MKTRAVIYKRVSSDDQTRNNSPKTQEDECRKYCKQQGYKVIEVYYDEGVSGAKLDRPALDNLRDAAEHGAFDIVVTLAVDRLARDVGFIVFIERELARCGVTVEYVQGGFNNGTPEGELHKTIVASFGQYERAKMLERVRRGARGKAKSGRWVGAGSVPYGYDKIGERESCRLEINDYEAGIVRRIFDLYAEKYLSIAEIARILTGEGIITKWHKSQWLFTTVKRALKYRGYLGVFNYDGIEVYRPELQIVDLEIFNRAQARFSSNVQLAKSHSTRHTYILTGRLYCKCGRKMFGHSAGAGLITYRCAGSTGDAKRKNPHECREPRIPAQKIEATVWVWFRKLASQREHLRKVIDETIERAKRELEPSHKRLALLDTMIEEVAAKVGRLVSRLADVDDETIAASVKEELQRLAQQRESYQREKERIEQQIRQADWLGRVSLDDVLRELGNIGLTNDPADRRRALERYRVRVSILTADKISVECTLAPKPETIQVKDYADMDAVMTGREDVVANSISVTL
jgi:site-specific DNA recombinase